MEASVKLDLENLISAKMNQVAKDLEKNFGKIQKDTETISKGFDKSQLSFGKLVAGMASGSLVASAITKIKDSALGLVGALIKQNSTLEQSKVSFGVMLGSATEADELLRKLYKFAADTPFETTELLQASKSLLAFGSTAKGIPNELKAIGDIASGVNAPIGELAELFGKAKVQGTLFAEDINQLVGRGIPVIQEFAKQLGVSESKVKKLASEGKITFTNLERAFSDLTSEGGKFNGMMAAQSKTFAGMFSTLKDNLSQMLISVGSGGAFDVMTQTLKRANEWLGKNQLAIANMSREIGAKLGQAVQFAVDNVDSLIFAGKVLLGIFAISKLVAIAGAIKGIGLALAGIVAVNPVLLAMGAILGTAAIAYSQAKKSSEDFNNEAQNIKEGEKQLSQYNSTLQKVGAMHKKMMEGPNIFSGIKAPPGTPANPKSPDGKKPLGMGLSEQELEKQAKTLQSIKDKYKDATIAGIEDQRERESTALATKFERERRELQGNKKALIELEKTFEQEKANLKQKFDDEDYEARIKAGAEAREAKYQNELKMTQIQKKEGENRYNDETQRIAREKELNELRKEQQWSIAGNLIAAGQAMLSHNKKNAGLLKALAIGEILINTARGMAASWSKGPWGIATAISIGALGAAQIAKVASQKFEAGGPVIGPRHNRGGVQAELEGGEFVWDRNSVRRAGGFQAVDQMRRNAGNTNNISPTINIAPAQITINGNTDPVRVQEIVNKSNYQQAQEIQRGLKWMKHYDLKV